MTSNWSFHTDACGAGEFQRWTEKVVLSDFERPLFDGEVGLENSRWESEAAIA